MNPKISSALSMSRTDGGMMGFLSPIHVSNLKINGLNNKNF